jgi:hypothetical protein
MPWGDSHCITFTEQAEASRNADHPGEETALSATPTHSEPSGCRVQVGISRLSASDRSLREAVLDLSAVCGPCGVQWVRGMRCAMLSIADSQVT